MKPSQIGHYHDAQGHVLKEIYETTANEGKTLYANIPPCFWDYLRTANQLPKPAELGFLMRLASSQKSLDGCETSNAQNLRRARAGCSLAGGSAEYVTKTAFPSLSM